MMSTSDRLVYMANQIARNLATRGDESAALAVADHIVTFWDPRMKAIFYAMEAPALDPIAARALALLRTNGIPPAQSAATSFAPVDAVGGSDAG